MSYITKYLMDFLESGDVVDFKTKQKTKQTKTHKELEDDFRVFIQGYLKLLDEHNIEMSDQFNKLFMQEAFAKFKKGRT